MPRARPRRAFGLMEQVAHAQQRNRRQPRHCAGANGSTAGGDGLAVLGQRFFHEEAGERGDKAVVAPEILCPLRRGRREADAPPSALHRGQGIRDSSGQRDSGLGADRDTVDIRAPIAGDGQPQALSRIQHEFPHRLRVAQHGIGGFQLLTDLVRLQGALGESGTVDALPFGVPLPAGVEGGHLRGFEAEIKLKLIRAGLAAAQEQGVEHCFRHAFALLRHRNVRPQGAMDFPCLVEQHIEHDAIDRAVRAEIANGLDQWDGLSVAVHPALALLEAVWIPGQVLVEGGREGVLQVDPLAQAVGGDEHAAGFVGKLLNLGAALLIAHAARDRDHAQIREGLPQRLAQPFSHIIGRSDVAAPEDGVKSPAQ